MDVNQLFRRAEVAFSANRFEQARPDLLLILSEVGDHPSVLHLLALVERRTGKLDQAIIYFERALAAAPTDPQLLSNYANLLGQVGRLDEAIASYDKALQLSPMLHNVRLNRAIMLQRADRHEEAVVDLDRLTAEQPADHKVRVTRAISLQRLGRLDDAADDFDAALARDPQRPTALHGRARVALERGEADASAYYWRALQIDQGNHELLLGFAEALFAEGDPTGMSILRQNIKRDPDWYAGYEVLARMRAEAGERDTFADHFVAAITARPGDLGLRQSYCHTLTLAGRYSEAIEVLRGAPGGLPKDHQSKLAEVLLLEAVGDRPSALAIIDDLQREGFTDPNLSLAQGRIALANRDPSRAAGVLRTLVEVHPEQIAGWAYLDLSWRLLGDSRHEWLSGESGLIAQRSLELPKGFLNDLAQVLRGLHRTRSHPLGQSLRGGTQTRGRLFSRREAEIATLHNSVTLAVHSHFQGLPQKDERHPLLRHKTSQVSIAGSWSVRLSEGGFHISHIHPEGILSSACHITLPKSVHGQSNEGWLEIGRPPNELGLDLEPLRTFEPVVGSVVLFPSYLFHGTTPFSKGERLTVAFDVLARC